MEGAGRERERLGRKTAFVCVARDPRNPELQFAPRSEITFFSTLHITNVTQGRNLYGGLHVCSVAPDREDDTYCTGDSGWGSRGGSVLRGTFSDITPPTDHCPGSKKNQEFAWLTADKSPQAPRVFQGPGISN